MAAALLLDLLIFIVPLMLIPLGLWRGGAHEVVVGGGILLGWAVATEWAGAWGGGLASLTGTPDDGMTFVVSCLLLAVGAAVGHLGGMVMGLPRPEADGRIAGAVLAWLNGILFLTLALGIYGRSLGGDEPMPLIERGFLTAAVIDHQGAVLLGIAVVVVVLLGTVLWVNAAVGQVYDPAYVPGRRTVFTSNPPPPDEPRAARTDPRRAIVEPYSNWPTAPRQRPVSVPLRADAGKVEPEPSRLRTALSRIGPSSPDGERSRRASLAEMFSQTLPVDLRDRSGRTETAPPSPPTARSTDAPSTDAPPARRAPPTKINPGPRRELTSDGAARIRPGGVAGARARRAGGQSPASPGNEQPVWPMNSDGSDRPVSPIGEWLRVASGMVNPMMAPPPTGDRSGPRPADGGGSTPSSDEPSSSSAPAPADPPPPAGPDGAAPGASDTDARRT